MSEETKPSSEYVPPFPWLCHECNEPGIRYSASGQPVCSGHAQEPTPLHSGAGADLEPRREGQTDVVKGEK